MADPFSERAAREWEDFRPYFYRYFEDTARAAFCPTGEQADR